MSVQRIDFLVCDALNCGRRFEVFNAEFLGDARDRAADEGWRRKNERDWCPRCGGGRS